NNAPVAADDVIVCNLSDKGADWAHKSADKIAIDPVLGRIAFPENSLPPSSVSVTYRYGFTMEMGGGEYGRDNTFTGGLEPIIKVPSDKLTIQAALDEIATSGGVVEIENNDYFVETPTIKAPEKNRIELRAADERRSVIVLASDLLITGEDNSEVILNGLLISGGSLRVPAKDSNGNENRVRLLRLRHCTLIPGASPAIKGVPAQSAAPRIFIESPNTILEIDHCIVGGIRAVDGADVRINESIIDAVDETEIAYAGLTGAETGAPLRVVNSTIIGKVHTLQMDLASNTIFLASLKQNDVWIAPVQAEKLQQGCVRFSFIPPGSRLPRLYQCQPKNIEDAARVRPVFTSLRYGDPGYCQLSLHCAIEIRRGADDQAEMGVFHNLYQPQREANLRAGLDEYLRFGLEAGIFYAS
ncbi:MAG: hypothetical protein AB1489_25340, partial [Acidobacteriota bacterium]